MPYGVSNGGIDTPLEEDPAMSATITQTRPAQWPQVAPLSAARPHWNPYLTGFLLGLVLLLTYALTGRGLGATAAFAAIVSWIVGSFSPAHVESNLALVRYWNDGAPLQSWTLFLLIGALIGAFLSGWQGRRLALTIERGPNVSDRTRLLLAFAGGFVAAFGARIAKGCTSGQALTGGSLLNAGSLAFMAACFASAYALAYLVRKEWL
jgi:uncharacterized membrane protein YedE/YeeE